MAYKDLEVGRAHSREYYWQHRDKYLLQMRAYYRKNRKYRLEHQAKHNEEHKIADKERHLGWRNKLKIEVFSHYSSNPPICAWCEEDDLIVLCIDHINGGGHAHRKSIGNLFGSSFYYWLRKNNYPEGYQVLCYNCNIRKKYYNKEVRR